MVELDDLELDSVCWADWVCVECWDSTGVTMHWVVCTTEMIQILSWNSHNKIGYECKEAISMHPFGLGDI